MVKAGSNERIYSAAKIAAIVEALTVEGVLAVAALEGVGVSHDALNSPATRVALDQIIECYHNAARLTRDPHFALHLGLKVHVSAYGMYGFALLSGTDFRKIMKAAVKYHRLVAPLAEIAFHEDGERASWSMTPIPHSRVERADVQVPGRASDRHPLVTDARRDGPVICSAGGRRDLQAAP